MNELAFRVLGPLEVAVDGREVLITATRQRIVLAVLLMAANRLVTMETLIDAVYDEQPPTSARAQIQICISVLRNAIGAPNLIETSPGGYRIAVRHDQLDCVVFDTAVARAREAAEQGRLTTALECLDGALRLWRGPALPGLPGRVAETLASRLEERRLMAIEDHFEIRLGLGTHRELVEELVELTARHPLRERLWGFLMIALYRSGRQAEALATYRSARRALVEELGLEPGERLRALEQAILSQDASLDLDGEDTGTAAHREPKPRQLPADIPDFAGRAELVETLAADLADSARKRDRIPLILITGAAGCGKSTLAVHLAHTVRRLFPDGQLYAQLHGTSADPTPIMEVLAAFLRALGADRGVLPVDREERIALLRSHLADRRLLIVLDDAADHQRLDDLLPGVPGPAVLITSRDRLSELPGARVVDLGTLSEPESLRLLARMAGQDRIAADDPAVSRLIRLCCGLPLALRIAGMRLAAHPHWSVSTMVDRLADESGRLDELSHGDVGVRPLLTFVYDALSAQAARLLQFLSLLDMHDFSPLVAAALLDCEPRQAGRVLDELAAARMLAATPSVDDQVRYRFDDLTRIFAREQSADRPTAERAAAIERVLGCLLATADEAYRRFYGGDHIALQGESPRWAGAAAYFDRVLSDPMAWFEAEHANLRASVAQAAALGLDEFCWELAHASVTFYENRGLYEEWHSTHLIALDAVSRAGNRRGLAAVLASLGGSLGIGQHFAEDEKMLLESLMIFTEIGDPSGRALALCGLAHLDRIHGEPELAIERYRESLDGFRGARDVGAQAHVLSGLARAHLDRGDLESAEALAKESLILGQEVRNNRLQAQSLYRLGEVLLGGAQTRTAKAVFQETLELARAMSDRVGQAYAFQGLGTAALELGDLDTAEVHFTRALELCRLAHERNIHAHVHLGLAQLHSASRATSRAEQHYAQAADLFAAQANHPWHSLALDALDEVHRETGRPMARHRPIPT